MTTTKKPDGIVWHPVGGSVRGSSHEASGKPNQDSWAATAPGEIAAVAVADGHGSERSTRSADGSKLAVELTIGALESAAHATVEPRDLAAMLRDQSGPWVVATWRERILAHAQAHPFTAEELAAIGTEAPGEWETLRAYGCTLLGICATPRAVGLLQLGDGDIVCVAAAGPESIRPIPEDPTNVAQFTSSLCQDEPLRSLRVAAVDLARTPLTLAFGSTDGFGTAYTDTNWWVEVGPQLAQRAADMGPDAFNEKVPSWLAEPARVAGDDTTMAVLLATGPGAPPIVPAPPSTDTGQEQVPPQHDHLHQVPPPGHEHRRRRRRQAQLAAAITAGATAIGAGVVVLVLANGGDGGPRKPTGPFASAGPAAPADGVVDDLLAAAAAAGKLFGPDGKDKPTFTQSVDTDGGTWKTDGNRLHWQPKGGTGFDLDFKAPLSGLELARSDGRPSKLLVLGKDAIWSIALDTSCPGQGASGCLPTCVHEKAKDACATAAGAPKPEPAAPSAPAGDKPRTT